MAAWQASPVALVSLSITAPSTFFISSRGFRASAKPDVDHFIPWSRYPDDGLENLVVAHARCNAQKSDFLAAAARQCPTCAAAARGSPVCAVHHRLAET